MGSPIERDTIYMCVSVPVIKYQKNIIMNILEFKYMVIYIIIGVN